MKICRQNFEGFPMYFRLMIAGARELAAEIITEMTEKLKIILSNIY